MLARRGSSKGRRQSVVVAAALAVVTVFIVFTALPAWAHHPVLSGRSVCSDGEHVITWTIGNSEPVRSMHIDTAVATIGADTFAVTGYAPDLAGAASTTATTTIPGGTTGTVTLTVHSAATAERASTAIKIGLVSHWQKG